jgi:DNA polymerase-3 subunit epsilon
MAAARGDSIPPRLARRVLIRDEVPNHAGHVGPLLPDRDRTQPPRTAGCPGHGRGIARTDRTLGSFNVFTLEEAIEFARAITPAQRKKRYLADGLPDAPGVYLFRDGRGRPLYIGTSTSILHRVRSYFTAAESRKRISEMIHIAERVDAVVCAHSLEAEIRELRLIAAHKPPYNRRSKFPERTTWLKLTVEPYPRLSMVARVKDDGAGYLGPFGSRHAALLAMDAVYEAIPLRQCRRRLSAKLASPACVLAELGRCAAPCELRVSREEYHRQAVEPFARALAGDPGELIRGLLARIETLAGRHRYEQAAQVRARMAALLRATVRMQRLTALTALTEVVAARPAVTRPGRPDGGWEIAVIRRGRLVAAGTSVRRRIRGPRSPRSWQPPKRCVPASARPRAPVPKRLNGLISWLERPEVRLVECPQGWTYPASGAARFAGLLEQAEAAHRTMR